MEESKNITPTQSSQKIFCKQPISCPWIASQPYPSAMNKNRATESSMNKSLPSIPLSMESRTISDKTCPSLQHSSSQFFYFLRLMQLFPETHPATLHTVLNLCKNDFFCAVDKLLYAKRCKAIYSRSQSVFKRCPSNRSHPYCGAHGAAPKNLGQQEKARSGEAEAEANADEVAGVEREAGASKVQILMENNFDIRVANGEPNVLKLSSENEPQLLDVAPDSVVETTKIVEDLSTRKITEVSET